ncbi:MAG: 4Fe-4S binding protein [Pseudomonadota bacterium]|nr:4Fe-4S binding protein [Pseudomonadota bacterium]
MREIIDTVRDQLKLPQINGERCVHALVESASCHACIEACPRDAWRLSDESLGIAVDACDGCGLCAPACPEGAILFEQPQVIRQVDGAKTLLLACERASLEPDTTTAPCVHLPGTGDLLKLHREEVRAIALCSGDCEECDRGGRQRESLQGRIEAINGLLAARRQPAISCRQVTPGEWPRLWQQTRPAAPGADLNRRQFLRRALQSAVEEGARLQRKGAADEAFVPPGKLLPNASQELAPASLPFPAAPAIDSGLCNGCDACARICPHQAIRIEQKENHLGYRIDAAACTACNLCVDICEEDAVAVVRWQAPAENFIPLTSYRCKTCGINFHLPADPQQEQTTCRICSRTNHYRNLYQVLD